MAEFQAKPFGEYYLLERVAVGGMAEIFKAKTYGVGGFEKQLAIKRILPHHAQNQEFISMLIDEAKIAVALNHVNIVQVFDLGKIENDYFIAMEFVDGRDLRTVMRRCIQQGLSLSVENVVYVMLEICKGLDYAHRKTDKAGRGLDVVHRDISPQNILISFEGEVKIVDFGIAKAANKVTETEAGVLKGKFSYMSPEQAQGYSLDSRTDIFSTGIIMYELLTGDKLFSGKNHAEILDKIRNFRLEHPFLPANVPSVLEFILAGALEPDLDQRYANASEFQIELSKYLYSTAADFTSRGLADLMRRLFDPEREAENARERVNFEIDEQTRSFMLRSHSQSLVSKSEMAYDESEEHTADLPSGEAGEQRSIIQRFQKAMRRDSSPAQPRVALQQVMAKDLQKPPVKREVEEATQAIAAPPVAQRPPVRAPTPPPPPRPQPLPSAPRGPISAASSSMPTPMTLTRKIGLLVAFVGILSLILVLTLVGKHSAPSETPDSESSQAATTSPESSVEEPADRPSPEGSDPAASQDPLRRAEFDPNLPAARAATAIFETEPIGARVLTANGRELGLTPLTVTKIPAGERLEFQLDLSNYFRSESVLFLTPGETKRIRVPLDPLTGILEINTTPAKARVSINGKYIGLTPLRYDRTKANIPTVLKVQKEGYDDYVQSFTIKPSETRIFNKVLEESSRVLVINSFPPGGSILLDGSNRGVTPQEFPGLPAGAEYILTVRHPGYRDKVMIVKIGYDERQEVMARLERQQNRRGTVLLESEPSGASVYWNGRLLEQKTPLVLDELAVDQVHSLKVTMTNYQTTEFRLKVDPETVVQRRAVMERLKARLTVKSDPPNAEVYLNGRKLGETPLAYLSVDAGEELLLSIRKPGFREQNQRIKLAPEQQETLTFSLTESP